MNDFNGDMCAKGIMVGSGDLVCPTCGESVPPELREGIVISFPDIDGTYCMKCWAKFISENIPKMIPVNKKDNE